jgi:uncharacterized protein (DUF1800 family)
VDCLFNHPNLPPFVATRLIRFLVTSNPSPAYIQRVAQVFASNSSGVRGDLRATLQAVLMDAEARQDVPTPTIGMLREPLLHFLSFAKALNGQVSPTNGLGWMFVGMGQTIMTPNSVFNWYSPLFRIPKTTMFGPQFQIYSPTEAVLRANLINDMITGQLGSDVKLDLTPFNAVAGNTAALIDAVDQALLYGRMSAQTKQSITNALNADTTNATRVQTALWLAATSGDYAVQH